VWLGSRSAAAVAGKRVLHLDHEAHYGSQFASLSFPALLDWVAQRPPRGARPPTPRASDARFGALAAPVNPREGDAALYGAMEVDDLVGDGGR
jgi:RAB protein geranylgeranyltransferase component A